MNKRLLIAAVVAASSSPALAWDSPEHHAFGLWAYSRARSIAETRQLPKWTVASPDELVGTYAAEADFCHSYWHAPKTKTMSNGAGGTIRPVAAGVKTPDCDIYNGESGKLVPGFEAVGIAQQTAQNTSYLLSTNTNHFGHTNPQRHYRAFHAMAVEAARRAYAHRDDSAKSGICQSLALTLQGFGMHYLQDRTAAGHAWNHDTRNYDYLQYKADAGMRMSGMRGCFHDQDRKSREGIEVASHFSCLDPTRFGFGDRIRLGLGGKPRNFGGEFFDSTWNVALGWLTDGAVPQDVPAAQKAQVIDPAVDSLMTVWKAYATGEVAEPAPWTETYVSNFEMCTVAVSLCCHKPFAKGKSNCDYCAPDITPVELESLCIADGNTAKSHAPDDAASAYATFIQDLNVDGSTAYFGGQYWTALKDTHSSTWASETTVAATIAASATAAPVHDDGLSPDAAWDLQNDILNLAGCTGPKTCEEYAAERGWNDLKKHKIGEAGYECPLPPGETSNPAPFVDNAGFMCCRS